MFTLLWLHRLDELADLRGEMEIFLGVILAGKIAASRDLPYSAARTVSSFAKLTISKASGSMNSALSSLLCSECPDL